MSEYPVRLGNGQDTAVRMRAADAAVRLGTTAVRARGGLRPDGGGVVSAVAGTMQVQVTAFSCWVDMGSVGQVGFPFILDATATLTLDPGDATLARVDTIAVVADASTPTTATLQVVKGTPGAGAPALPAYAVALRDVNVPAGLSSGSGGLTAGNLSTDRRVYAVAAGGVLPVGSSAERDALGAKEGQPVYRRDTDTFELFNGTTWDSYSPDGGAWTSYVPSFTAGGSTVTVNNGSWSAAHRKRGRQVDFRSEFTVGSLTSFPAGQLAIGLPFAAVNGHWSFTGMMRYGASVIYCVGEYDQASGRLLLWCEPTTSGGFWRAVTSSVPAGLATGHTITLSGTFESTT